MEIRKIAADSAGAVRRFVRLEEEVNARHPLVVPSPRPDVERRLSGRSALHRDVEWVPFVASDAGRDVARCAAFVNRRYQEFHGEAVGFVGYLAAAPGVERGVVEMLGEAEAWLAARGVTRVIAPYNGHFLAGMAVRTAGFDEEPVFPLPWHPPHYADYLEAAGYRPSYPWWSYRVDFSSQAYRDASRRALETPLCRVRPLDKKRWDADLDSFTRLYNETFCDEWEYHPWTIEDVREVFGPFKPVLDPRQTLFAEVDGETVGFCVGIPDWTPLARRLRGRMGVLQQIRFALGARRFRHAGLLFVGVLEAYRGKHIGQTMAATLYRRYEALGLPGAEYHIVNDANTGSRNLAASLGGVGRVLYHNFDKPLR